jgi:hypothetical protein
VTTADDPAASRLEQAIIALLLATLIATPVIAVAAPDLFDSWFAAEDGPVESATALFLALGAVLLWRMGWRARRGGPRFGPALLAVYGAAFLFAAGEEVSWGQRLLGLETPEVLARHNDQGELTLHNLVVFGVKLDELVFGNLLSLAILTYLLVLPFVWRRWRWAQRLVHALAIPVPRPRHAALTLAATLVIVLVDAGRKWEVYELCFALISASIFLAPANADLTAAARSSRLPS